MINEIKETNVNDRNGIISKIPGYRSNKVIKKIIATMYYAFWGFGCITSLSISDLAVGIAMLLMLPIGCYIFDIVINKEKRNSKNIIKTILVPSIVFVGLMNISISEEFDISAEDKAIEELGISNSEYRDILLKYDELIIKLSDIKENQKKELEQYNEKVKELEIVKGEFEEYKERIPQDKVEELEKLKTENEDYANKKEKLEKEIKDLEDKIK